MKIRNRKLIMAVLIATLTVGGLSVPVSAKSKNTFNKTVSIAQGTVLDETRGLYFTMHFEAGQLNQGATFFIESEDFVFNSKLYKNFTDKDIELTYQSRTKLKVMIDKTSAAKNINIPIYGEVTSDKPTLIVDGDNSTATSGEYPLTSNGTVEEYALTVAAGDIPNIAVDGAGPIAPIQIIENVAGTLKSGSRIRLTLPSNSNLKFREPDTLKVEGIRGTDATYARIKVDEKNSDDKNLWLIIEGINPSATRGGIKIQGIEVMPERKGEKLDKGDVKITLRMDDLERTELVVGRVAEEGVNLSVKEEVVLAAGKESKTVEVTISENTAGSLSRRHNVYFEVKGAKVVPGTLKVVGDSKITLEEDIDNKTKEVVGFTLDTRRIDPINITKLTFSFELEAEAGEADDITLVADAYKFEEKVKLGTVKPAVGLKMNPIVLRTALKDQVGGELIISETRTGLFNAGEEIIIAVEKAGEGITFTDAKVAGEDVRLKTPKFEDGKIILTIERGSDEKAVIRLSDLEICVAGLVEEGSYDVVLSGSALSDHKNDEIVLKDVLKVGKQTQETQGVTANFIIDEAFYTLNDKVEYMDATPYLTQSGRVMVPIKYVADAFDIKGDKMKFSNEKGGTITLETEDAIVQLVNGSKMAIVNGVQTPMDESVTIQDGRTYVPVGPVARFLGIDVKWSEVTKTATFTKN